MIYKEEKRDLFSVPEDYYLVQCISADLAMGKGIAVEFNKRFKTRDEIRKRYGIARSLANWDSGFCGTCICIDRVFNLISKRNYWDKPTYQTLSNALTAMRILCDKNNITKIAMPLIGCGLDRLKWEKVSKIIKTIFANKNIEILVCRQ